MKLRIWIFVAFRLVALLTKHRHRLHNWLHVYRLNHKFTVNPKCCAHWRLQCLFVSERWVNGWHSSTLSCIYPRRTHIDTSTFPVFERLEDPAPRRLPYADTQGVSRKCRMAYRFDLCLWNVFYTIALTVAAAAAIISHMNAHCRRKINTLRRFAA